MLKNRIFERDVITIMFKKYRAVEGFMC